MNHSIIPQTTINNAKQLTKVLFQPYNTSIQNRLQATQTQSSQSSQSSQFSSQRYERKTKKKQTPQRKQTRPTANTSISGYIDNNNNPQIISTIYSGPPSTVLQASPSKSQQKFDNMFNILPIFQASLLSKGPLLSQGFLLSQTLPLT